jgi:hypothetical protein
MLERRADVWSIEVMMNAARPGKLQEIRALGAHDRGV